MRDLEIDADKIDNLLFIDIISSHELTFMCNLCTSNKVVFATGPSYRVSYSQIFREMILHAEEAGHL